jgi:glycosyltransferase involved in cell wall biosynthesis
MTVDSKNIEFGYELISVIPYAYYHRSKLKGTVSGNDTAPLYYFSPDHKINPKERKFGNISKVRYPNFFIHKPYLDKSEFEIPPYKEVYANDKFKFDKETVVICNRANIEWSYKMINYFDVPTLRRLFDLLKDKYQIVYINVEGRKELYDGIVPEPIGDFELLKEYPEVINFHDLIEDSWNKTQLEVFANCEKFITMNGGHAILASYFGGENIVMSKPGKIQAKELNAGINSFYTFYHEFNKGRTVHVENENDLINRVKLQWIDKEPIVNILLRTSNRPEYFEGCMESIYKQSYKNINVFVSKDNDKDKYTINHKVYPIRVNKQEIKEIDKENYGRPFPANLYFNELHKYVKSGLVIYLDDDDQFNNNNAVKRIVDEYKKGNDLIFWKVKINDRVIPTNKNFGKEPVCRDISGIGFAFDSKYMIDWEGYKLGDYRISKQLYNTIENKSFINKIFTKSQEAGNGFGFRLDKNISDMDLKIRFTNPAEGSKYKKGDIVEMDSDVAKNYVVYGYAEFVESEKQKKKSIEKKPANKRGRPKKTA